MYLPNALRARDRISVLIPREGVESTEYAEQISWQLLNRMYRRCVFECPSSNYIYPKQLPPFYSTPIAHTLFSTASLNINQRLGGEPQSLKMRRRRNPTPKWANKMGYIFHRPQRAKSTHNESKSYV